jgi:hypothetical protein
MMKQSGLNILQTKFLLNVTVQPFTLSSDLAVQLQDLTASTSNLLTRQLDINGDGFVNIFDASIAGAAYGSTLGSPKYKPKADFNADGTINIFDFAIFGSNWQAPNFN